jgi:hypothetical protein
MFLRGAALIGGAGPEAILSPMTPEERSRRSRIAAHHLHAQGKTNTKPARAAFMDRFYKQVDPDGKLPEAERHRRAEHAMRAHMLSLSAKSARARRR